MMHTSTSYGMGSYGMRPAAGRTQAVRVINKESRIGKQPVVVPKGVDVKIDARGAAGTGVAVKGKLGQLSQDFTEHVTFNMDGDTITVRARRPAPRRAAPRRAARARTRVREGRGAAGG